MKSFEKAKGSRVMADKQNGLDIILPPIEVERRSWIVLDFESKDSLRLAIEDRKQRILFYPSIGKFEVGNVIDIEVVVEDTNIHFPMTSTVIASQSRKMGPLSKVGTFLEVVPEDAARFEIMCSYADGRWIPGSRRVSPRLRTEIEASYYLPPDFHSGETIDISPDGIFLRTEGPIQEVGKGVYIRLKPSGLWLPISLSARVCWIEAGNKRGMGLYCFESKRSLKRLAKLFEKLRKKMKVE